MAGVLIRETTAGRSAFLETLAQVLEDKSYSVDGDVVTVEDGRMTIQLTDKEQQDGGQLLLADFAFEGMSDDEIRGFMERFDRSAEDTVAHRA